MKVLISSIGSRGDVQPMLALAMELRALGHTASLCAAPNFRPWVEAYGIPFVPLGPDVKQFVGQTAAAPRRKKPTRAQLRSLVPQSVREQFQVLGEAARGCELLVGGTLQAAAPSVAESLGIPYVYVAYSPVVLTSPNHPPPMIRPQSLPRLVNRALWLVNDWSWNRTFRDATNEQRARLGLRPVADMWRYVSTDHPWLAADAALAPADPCAGVRVTQTGAWLLPDDTPLPEELERFLGEGDAPVYFGFGSTGAFGGMGELFVEAARAVGRRAILLRGWANVGVGERKSDCIVVDDLNFDRLFPRVAAIVHHGGAGTTTAAARAGKPQLVVPTHYDQFYWAHRVRMLGIGVEGPNAKRLSADVLARALQGCLRSEKAAAAQAIAGRIQERGAREAAERLVKEYAPA